MEKFIGDEVVVLNLQGLRWIQKENMSAGWTERFRLKWNYKGGEGTQSYESEESRNAMYDKVLKALTETTK